ncbi:MAG: endonuclease domain-containing protein [Patescibacteria group bacterium]
MTKILYNHPNYLERRRNLRKDQTPEEKIIWEHLRKKKLGYLFWRQYSAGLYVLDFYCPKLRLAIEIDGLQHATRDGKEYDEEREQYLLGLDIKMLRFWNSEVRANLETVLEKIKREIAKSSELLPLR